MENKVIEGFKKDFLAIKKEGWIPSNRFHDTGIGKTFEDFIGVIENNKSSADYKGTLELKSARELSESMITLFTKSPEPRGVNGILREKFGYFDEEHKNTKILNTTFSAVKFNTCKSRFCFSLEVNDKENKIKILVKDDLNNFQYIDAYYPFDELKEIIDKKCQLIVFINADNKKEEGREFFKFTKAILLSGLTFEKFINFIKKGFIVYDIRLGVYRSGKMESKTHDHGSGFRIPKNNINKIFDIKEL